MGEKAHLGAAVVAGLNIGEELLALHAGAAKVDELDRRSSRVADANILGLDVGVNHVNLIGRIKFNDVGLSFAQARADRCEEGEGLE